MTVDRLPEDVGQRTKRDAIAEELRRLIMNGDIARGTRMRQEELAARFDASITPVREAIRQLEAEGLLESEPRRGVRVATLELDRIKGVYVSRRLLEPYALQRASLRVSRNDISMGRHLNDEMAAATEAESWPKVGDLNRRFHFDLYNRCGIPALAKIIEGLWLSFPWDILGTSRPRVEQSIREHASILDALEGGDMTAIREAAELHVLNGYVSVTQHLLHPLGALADPFEFRNE
jgi:DNA-binding GntR family transcriptional regulator